MSNFSVQCSTKMTGVVNPSESPERVTVAIRGVFPECVVMDENGHIIATSSDIKSLENIRDAVRSRQSQKAFRRILERHTDGNSTWFYLNKQAGFAGKVAVCAESDESPLGPIRVTITSYNLKDVIKWLASAD
ncbi:MAG: hypothetical protein OXC46_04415 [Thaumarchaeota archaeon]|nr:hypothetical protein [Nitrososphaerota archaeon]